MSRVPVRGSGPNLDPTPMELAPTADDVRSAYIWIFGREVESEAAVEAHLAEPSRGDLRLLLLSSEEFFNTYFAATPSASAGEPAETPADPNGVDPLDAEVAPADTGDAVLWLLGGAVTDDAATEGASARNRRELRRRLLESEAFSEVFEDVRRTQIAGDPLLAPPSRQDVRNAFLWVLGRDAESESAVDAHVTLRDRRHLRQALMSSQEFAEGYATEASVASSRWVAAEVLDGRLIWLDLYDRFVSRGVLKETWKQAETRLVRSLLKPGDNFVDAGAGIGWFSVVAAECVGRFGQVQAFEPGEQVRARLEKTVAVNGLSPQVTVSPFALWDSPAQARLAQDPAVYNPGHAWVTMEADDETGSPVECRRLDDVLDLPKLALLKLSLEGAEFRALQGAEGTLRSQSPVVLTELNVPMLRKVSCASAGDLHQLMAGYGYSCRLVAPDGYDGAGQPHTRTADADDLEALGPDAIQTLLFTC